MSRASPVRARQMRFSHGLEPGHTLVNFSARHVAIAKPNEPPTSISPLWLRERSWSPTQIHESSGQRLCEISEIVGTPAGAIIDATINNNNLNITYGVCACAQHALVSLLTLVAHPPNPFPPRAY